MRLILGLLLGVGAVLVWGYLWPVTSKGAAPIASIERTDIGEREDNSPEHAPLATYLDILERPLFTPSRRIYASPGTETAYQPPEDLAPPVDVWVTGLLKVQGRAQVLVKTTIDASDGGVWLSEGETYENLRVVRIDGAKVVIETGGREISLSIRDGVDQDASYP